MKQIICIFLLAVLSLGCQNKNDKLNNFIAKTFPDLINGEILIIPNSGCTGCISEAENSLDSLLRLKNFKVVFSQIQSLKTLKYRLSSKNIDLQNPDIFVDTANLYTENSESYNELWAFPTKIIVRDRAVSKIFRQ